MSNLTSKPIGIFDSGVGGLTVFAEIRRAFPHEDIVYFGDTARVPYGSKSNDTILRYSRQNANFLLQRSVKAMVVACNTASAIALSHLQNENFDIPVCGVITPGAKKAVSITKKGHIGVIGTDATINSHAYLNELKHINSELTVIEKACPLFVPLAEEGWQDTPVALEIATSYLQDIIKAGVDTLILGCTHYPILKNTIQKVCGDQITLVDSALAIVTDLQYHLQSCNIENDHEHIGTDLFFVSDNETKFKRIAKNILGIEEMFLYRVRLDEAWMIDN